ncbi:(2Fe-2S)-binding protein [bacterium]|nr:(2Fe-2S)-binding protein [bacterium]
MTKVLYITEDGQTEVEVGLGVSLAEAGVEADVDIQHNCAFNGKCTTCRGRILEGENLLSPFSDTEDQQFKKKGIEPGYRLTCQCKVIGQGEIVVEVFI